MCHGDCGAARGAGLVNPSITSIRSSARPVPVMACSRVDLRYRLVPWRFSVKISTRLSVHAGGEPVSGAPNSGSPGH